MAQSSGQVPVILPTGICKKSQSPAESRMLREVGRAGWDKHN